jgi:hypothetical protein
LTPFTATRPLFRELVALAAGEALAAEAVPLSADAGATLRRRAAEHAMRATVELS